MLDSVTEARAIPKKVLSRAFDHGAHADCMAAGMDGACDMCVSIFFDALDFYYGRFPEPGDKLAAIMEDLLTDRDE
jgi:hypothetical protein